jgi:hypothetical protein
MLSTSTAHTANNAANDLRASKSGPRRAAATPNPRERNARTRDAYVRLPMRFEPNAGRMDAAIDFVARGAGYAVYLSSRKTTLLLDSPPGSGEPKGYAARSHSASQISMHLVGARLDVAGIPQGELTGRTNYLHGNDRRKWRTGIRAYERIKYHNVYPGVDVVYYGNQRQLEYDFVVAPGASYRRISIAFSGQTGLSIDQHGGLVIATAAGEIVQRTPVVYQHNDAGVRQRIDGGYVIDKNGHVRFRVGRYDRRRPLVIDPVIGYATYFGGSGGDEAAGIAVDVAGDVYITGRTGSLDFPARNAAQPFHGGPYYDAFVMKLNSAGDTVVYATYLGGSSSEYAADVHVDEVGNAFVVGTTYSPNFPTVGAYQAALAGDSDLFLTRLDSAGVPTYSTFLGGKSRDTASGLTVDALGRPYVTGWTFSTDFPLRNAIQTQLGGSPALKTTDGGGTWTAIKSGLNATGVRAIAVDPENSSTLYAATEGDGAFKSTDGGASWSTTNNGLDDPYVYSMVTSSLVPSRVYAGTYTGLYRSDDGAASWQRVYNLNGPVVAFAEDPSDPSTLYATGWAGLFKSTDGGETWTDVGPYEQVNSIAVSASAPSTIFIGTMQGVFKSTIGGGDWTRMGEEFMLGNTQVVAVDPTNPEIVYAATSMGVFRSLSGGVEWSLVGEFGQATSLAIAASNPSVLYASTGMGVVMSNDGGDTWAGAGLTDMPAWTLTVDPTNPAIVYAGAASSIDGILARFSADGAALEFSSYFGGSSFDELADVQVDAGGNVYVAGPSSSPDLPVKNALQPLFGGQRDLFVAKLSPAWEIVYATYVGGSNWEHGTTLGVDATGHVAIAGETYSPDFPRVNAHQSEFGGGVIDAFVAKLAPAGDSFVYSTLLGGNNTESMVTVAMAPSGEVVLSGTTGSLNFPTLRPFQATLGGGFIDFFVATFAADGALQSSTFLGGDGWEYNRRVAIAGDGRIWLTGDTHSTNFPTRDPLQSTKSAFNDLAIARLDPGVLDTTPPVTSLRAFGDLGPSGWYMTPVTIELQASDEGSGVAAIEYSLNAQEWMSYSAPFSIATSGTTTVRARAIDHAGNVEAMPVQASFNVDVEAPVITIDSPEARTYLHSEVLTISFAAVDAGSGLAADPVGGLDGTLVSNGHAVSLLTLPLGRHHISVSARDVAGNATKVSVTFEVVATVESLIAAVNAFTASGSIDPNTAGALVAKLEEAQQAIARGNVTVGEHKLQDFINQVNVKAGRGVTVEAANVLVADAQYVLGTM